MFDLEKQTIETVKKVAPAVVSIMITKMVQEAKDLKKERSAPHKMRVGGGSGFFVTSDGLILTNKHVVTEKDAEYVAVTGDGVEYEAKVLTRDPINDVAVLKAEVSDAPHIALGDSSAIELGQTAIAVGNALGMFSNTVSKGIISGLGRKVSAALGDGSITEHLRHVIQTDVAINQGNSGGPLVNLEGEAIGINTAVIFGAQNIGFAIPINWAKSDLRDLIEHGRIIRPYLGARYIMITKELKDKYHLSSDTGALVIRDHLPNSVAVVADSPAEIAGLKENDVITAINGEALTEDNEIADALDKLSVGDEISLDIVRGEEKLRLNATLSERT